MIMMIVNSNMYNVMFLDNNGLNTSMILISFVFIGNFTIEQLLN